MLLPEWSSVPCIHIHGIICPWCFDSDGVTDSYLPSSCYWQPGLIYITGINYNEGLLFSLMLLHLCLWKLGFVCLWLSLNAGDWLKTDLIWWVLSECCRCWISPRVSDVLPKWWGRRALIIACSCTNKNYWPNGDAKAKKIWAPIPSLLSDTCRADKNHLCCSLEGPLCPTTHGDALLVGPHHPLPGGLQPQDCLAAPVWAWDLAWVITIGLQRDWRVSQDM